MTHDLRRYTDKRDTKDLIATHIYLLFGCSYSLWMATNVTSKLAFLPIMIKLSGVIFLAIGDSLVNTTPTESPLAAGRMYNV